MLSRLGRVRLPGDFARRSVTSLGRDAADFRLRHALDVHKFRFCFRRDREALRRLEFSARTRRGARSIEVVGCIHPRTAGLRPDGGTRRNLARDGGGSRATCIALGCTRAQAGGIQRKFARLASPG